MNDVGYQIKCVEGKKKLVHKMPAFPLPDDRMICAEVLESEGHSIPICHFRPEEIKSDNLIVYAHGNSSDLIDNIFLMERIGSWLGVEVVIFDYTGFGCSSIPSVSEDSIRGDLENVLAWVKGWKELGKIILWGFSLGTYPVVCCAAKHRVRSVILECPFVSIGSLLLSAPARVPKIENDILVSMDEIHKIKSDLLILHSKDDEIIPFWHSVELSRKFIGETESLVNGPDAHLYGKFEFVEVQKLKHNQIQAYFICEEDNILKQEVEKFLGL